MYQLSRTVPVNEPKKSFLSRHDVWTGLLMKANNALPYVPEMKQCNVVEKGDGWLVRDIMLKDVPLREKVTFVPEEKVIFERTRGSELGRIENVIGEDANGNLTLTFAFSLKKDGIPEGSDAEKAHFAPMESAYLNAVASTLAAVRRTVDEKGREHLPPKNPNDAAGDTRWIYDYYRAVDAMDMERTLAQHTDDTTLTFANHPTVHGKEGYKAAIGHLWGSIKALSHSMTGAWSMHDGQVGVAEAIVQYTRMDDSLCAIKFCTVLRRRGDKIADIRIYGDATPLFAPAK
jgi:ketosteroid isomerase-like protein